MTIVKPAIGVSGHVVLERAGVGVDEQAERRAEPARPGRP